MNKQADYWLSLAQQGDFSQLARLTADPKCVEDRLLYVLWHARACRALAKGYEANEALHRVAHGKFIASPSQIAELAEELVQCAYFAEAGVLAEKLSAAGQPEADYIWALLWREREDWPRFNNALLRLRQHKTPIWTDLARVQEAWSALRQGRYRHALGLMQPFVNETNPGVQKLLARIELLSGETLQATRRLERQKALQPLDWESPGLLALAGMLTLFEKKGQSDDVIKNQIDAHFALSLSRQPRQPETLLNRANWFLYLGDDQAAHADCKEALRLKPWFDGPILLWVERAMRTRDLDSAKAILAKSRKELDTAKRSAAALDLLRLEGGKNQDIIKTAHQLIELFPADPSALRSAGAAMQAAKKPDLARNAYQAVLRLVPEDVATRNNLAMLHSDKNEIEEAINIWQAIGEEMSPVVRLNYAHALLQRGDRLEAGVIFRAVLQQTPSNPSALRGLANLVFEAGDDDAAWKYAMTSLQYDEKNPFAWKTASGIARRREGDKAALMLLQQGLHKAHPVEELRYAIFHIARGIQKITDVQQQVAIWCKESPAEVKYWLMAADAQMDANNFEQCERLLQQARNVDEDEGGPALARFYLQRARHGAARQVAEQLVRHDPSVMANWGLLAEILYQQERTTQALQTLEQGLQYEPTRLSLIRMKVGILLAQEQFTEAVATASGFFQLDTDLPALLLYIGTLQRAQQPQEAVAQLYKYLQNHSGHRIVRLKLAQALSRAGQYKEALSVLHALYTDEPNNFKVVKNYVRALAVADQLEKARLVLNALKEKSNDQPDLIASIADLLLLEGIFLPAQAILQEAVGRYPQNLEFWRLLAQLHKKRVDTTAEKALWLRVLEDFSPRRWARFAIPDLVRLNLVNPLEEELNKWRKAEPTNPQPWWSAFVAAKEMKKNRLALRCLEKLEALRGATTTIYVERAAIYQEVWNLSAAITEQRKAIELRPQDPILYEQLLNILVKAGDFDDFDRLMSKLELLLGDRRYGRYISFFFNINCHPTWASDKVWLFYKEWYERSVKPDLLPPKAHANTPDAARKLRIGYVSPDFRRHAVAYFSEPLLMAHDRDQFELYAYAHLDTDKADAYTERFKSYFDHWTETRGMSDNELERKIRGDGIDILVDLAGHTSNNRLSLMLRRPAPIQASWIWGAGQTTGMPQVDYFLTDSASVPPEHDAFMAEKVVRMTRPGLPFKPASDALDPTPLPCLSKGFITFGVLARPLRTNRQTVALWAKILQRVPTSILRFDHVPYAEADVQQRMIGYFADHGISSARLQFKNTRPHWQVYQEIDLQLDPFPAGSSTTASEGLYMERLVVTLKSRPPMGLITHGQLEAIGLDKLCTADTEDEYIEKTVALVEDFLRLANLSAGLRERMKISWLMDYAGYGREVAGMYRQMWVEWCSKQSGDQV